MIFKKRPNPDKLPQHVAFIMDGNGRWAKRRGLPRNFGHMMGYARMVRVVKHCANIGIPVVSIYAFSTENWKRPQAEIDEIFRIVRENMERDIPIFNENGIRVVTMGDITKFPDDLQQSLVKTVESTKNNNRCTLNLCVNYGGRDEIVRAVNKIISNDIKLISEEDFSKHLWNFELPDPDLVVRTSGEQRVSNFMLWQMAYSEFLFVREHWPSMNERLVNKCISAFQKRNRRFGKI